MKFERYKPLYENKLEEAFSEKDMERAVSLIKSSLEKRLGFDLIRSGKSQAFRKRRTGDMYGLKYFVSSTEWAIRFNWSESWGSEIHSVDFFKGKSNLPKWTLPVEGQSIVKIIPLIQDVLEGQLPKEIESAEYEEPIIPDLDLDYTGKDKTEIKFNQAIIELLDIFEKKGKSGVQSAMSKDSYSKKTIDTGSLKRLNYSDFMDYLTGSSNPNAERLLKLLIKQEAEIVKDEIDKKGYTPKLNDFYTFFKAYGRVQDEYYESLRKYMTAKVDKYIKSNSFLMDLAQYAQLQGASDMAQSYFDRSKLVDEIDYFSSDGGWMRSLRNFFDYIKYQSNLKIDFLSEVDFEYHDFEDLPDDVQELLLGIKQDYDTNGNVSNMAKDMLKDKAKKYRIELHVLNRIFSELIK